MEVISLNPTSVDVIPPNLVINSQKPMTVLPFKSYSAARPWTPPFKAYPQWTSHLKLHNNHQSLRSHLPIVVILTPITVNPTSLPNRPKQPIPNIPHTRPNHPLLRQTVINTPNPKTTPLTPLLRRPRQPLPCTNHVQNNDPFHAPFPQCLDRSDTRPASCDHRVDEDRCYGVRRRAGRGSGSDVMW